MDPQSAAPVALGSVILSRAGTGPVDFALGASSSGKEQLAIRLSCFGAGTATLTDKAGRLIVRLDGCTPFAVYGAGPVANAAKYQVMRLAVQQGTRWRIAVFANTFPAQR
jgi:hypothetical protein